jgi:hypothetical protein
MDTLDGTTETLHIEDDKIALERTFDAEPTIKAVHDNAMTTGGWSPTRELRHIAELPEVILQAHAHKRGIANYMDLLKPEYRKELLGIITSPDFRAFSPSGGKV